MIVHCMLLCDLWFDYFLCLWSFSVLRQNTAQERKGGCCLTVAVTVIVVWVSRRYLVENYQQELLSGLLTVVSLFASHKGIFDTAPSEGRL